MRLLTCALAVCLSAAHARAADAVLRFEPNHLRLHWDHRRWQLLTQDGAVLKDFGPAEAEARRALRLIHDLGLNQYGTVGGPRPVMEYWLVDGRAPRGLVRSDLRNVPLDATELRIEKMHGQWALREKTRVLFTFDAEADAARALALFQQHRFTHVGLLGLGVPLMTVYFGAGEEPAALTHGRHMGGAKFPRFAKNADGSPRIEQLKGKATGLEGVVPAVVPAVGAPNLRVSTALTDRKATFWRTDPGFGTPTESAPGGRIGFDWRQAQLRQDQAGWAITAGSQVIARVGSNVQDGRTLLSAIRHYRLTEQLQLGGDAAGRWFVAPPSSPRGVMTGLPSMAVTPDKLEAALVAGRYGLCEGGRLVLPVGERADDARQVLELLRRHGCDRVCQVGSGPDGVAILLRSR